MVVLDTTCAWNRKYEAFSSRPRLSIGGVPYQPGFLKTSCVGDFAIFRAVPQRRLHYHPNFCNMHNSFIKVTTDEEIVRQCVHLLGCFADFSGCVGTVSRLHVGQFPVQSPQFHDQSLVKRGNINVKTAQLSTHFISFFG